LETESKAIAQLCALSYMIPPKGRVRTKKGALETFDDRIWKKFCNACQSM